MPFEPIAIIGQSCILPGALNPSELSDLAINGKDVLSKVPEDYWRTDPQLVRAESIKNALDLTWCDRGGYVHGFDSVFDPEGFAISATEIKKYDPLVHWVLHTAGEALKDAGYQNHSHLKTGAIFGNLSYPSHSLNQFSESIWLEGQGKDALAGKAWELAERLRTDPINRFMSGLPAHILARALELEAGAFALDAACASSLYAMKLACDQLHDRRADLMLAGGVNRADDLIIHIGFCVLQAMSQTSRSRPFHQEADGLVPAEGAGFIALKRLDDAVAAGDTILGVIRAVGLSNDGKGLGLLVPSKEGQERAIRKAYEMSGLKPADISLVEAHATGTVVGDGVEVQSMGTVYEGLKDVPIGTIKSNIGHPITVSGVAGVVKVLGAMKAGTRPPTLHVEKPLEMIEASPFRLLTEAEPWDCREGPRRAVINNFGFGGNNAHLILEEWNEEHYKKETVQIPVSAPPQEEIAIVGMGAVVADSSGVPEFATALFSGRSCLRNQADTGLCGFTDPFELPLIGLRFPPMDLEQTLAQQLLILKATMEAMDEVAIIPKESTGAFIGMGCDPEVARSGLCWRLPQYINDWVHAAEAEDKAAWVEAARNQIKPVRKSASILGAMPNIPANRLCSQFDFQGLSFTVASEELSGVRSLDLAVRALKNKELDAAVVGAVDLCCEPVHNKAAQAVLNAQRQTPGDAAIVLVLKRLEDARRDNDKIYAIVADEAAGHEPELRLGLDDEQMNLSPLFGHAHAASGLLHIAAATLACYYRFLPTGNGNQAVPWQASQASRSARISIQALGGESATVLLTEDVKNSIEPKNYQELENRLLSMKNQQETKTTPGSSPQNASRTYPAHLDKIQMPPLPSAENTQAVTAATMAPPQMPAGAQGTGIQMMAPAPRLPSVLEGAPPPRTEISTFPQPVAPAGIEPGAPTPAPAQLPVPGNSPMENILGEMVSQSSLVASIHQNFLAQQAQVHEQFLRLRQQALSILAQDPEASMPAEYTAVPMVPQEAPVSTPPISIPEVSAPAPQASFIPPAAIEPPAPPIQKPPAPVKAEIVEKPAAQPPEAPKPEADKAPESKKPSAIDAVRTLFQNPVYIPPKGPTFDKEQLKILASGKISEVFGPLFEQQDDYKLQVRLPEEPLLLVDRITGIDAEPGSMGKGILWTETDILPDSWYLHDIYMPGGIMIESGQCDLTLISYLGIDFLNKGERVYRLLGCDLLYYGAPPKVGDTLCYQIHVDGHARMGEQRMFFFHYDCRVNGELVLSVRNGQAAFITHEEARNAGGVLWYPETGEHKPIEESRLDPPDIVCKKNRFSREEVTAFSEGRGYACFGEGFELLETHSKTPKTPGGMMSLLHEVTDFDPKGGPWGRGYIRVENKISPDDWFLPGHFKNDPCMPGTLMSDACMQTLAFYLAAMGYTVKRDGWRFDPVPNEIYQAQCRSQVTPDSKVLTYEAFIEEVIVVDGLYPTVYADLLATIDGSKSLHIRRLGIQLIPDFPLDCWPHLLEGYEEKRSVAKIGDLEFGYKSLLACAFGKPSDAFGKLGRIFDDGRHISRLPGPPYHFMTRVPKIDAEMESMTSGQSIEVEYDVPPDAWYFDENSNPTMPFCVLMEVALQPCGWLAVFEGGPTTSEDALYFRNLDGTGTMLTEIVPDTGTILTRSKLTNIARMAGQCLVNFDVECLVDDQVVYTMKTGFGFFSAEALAAQVGLGVTKEEIQWLDDPCDFEVDLTQRPERYFGGELRLPNPMLLMLDRITGYWPEEGGKGLGRLRSEKAVNISEWFFKAHFFHDPVQPGSLGVESIVQTQQFYMIHENMHEGIKNPRFRPIALDCPTTWKYRGQITPDKKRISIELNILERGRDENGPYTIAEGCLWGDDLKIFHVKNLKMQIVSGDPK